MSATVSPGPGAPVRTDQYVPLVAQAAIARANDAAQDAGERARAVLLLLSHGLLLDARAALADMPRTPDAQGVAGLCERLWRGEALLRATLPDRDGDGVATPRKCSSVLVAPCPGASLVLVVFSGIALVPFPTLAAFARRRDCHVVFLCDPTRRFLLARTPRLGADYAATLACVRAIVGALDGVATFCVGVSSGGYPALRFALPLAAHGVLSFSGPTTVDMDDDPGAPMSKYPQLVGIYRTVPHLACGMAAPYDAADPRPRAILVFGAEHPRDRFMAELMGSRIGPERGVSLRPIAGFAEHDTFSELERRGMLEATVDELLTLTPFSDRLAAQSAASAVSASMSSSLPLPPAAR